MTQQPSRVLRPVDVLFILFSLLLTIVILVFTNSNVNVLIVAGVSLTASAGIVVLAHAVVSRSGKILLAVYDWYPVPGIFLVFKEMHIIIQSIGSSDWDVVLIAIDHAMYGVHPTVWIGQFTTPLLTEILQIGYASYYFIMLAVGVEVFMRSDKEKFSYTLFIIVYGFFLSYLGYAAFPAVGPRFTLHDFFTLDADLPGLFLTTSIRDFLNAGESIPKGAINALALAQRDAFPSGHTQMTLISLYLASQYRLRSRYVLYVFGTLLIISTVYMRYHYVIDVIGGVVFAVVTIWTAQKLFRRLDGQRKNQ